MKTKTINIYKFEELKRDIQEEVLNRFREENEYPFLSDILKESLNELLTKNKIKEVGTTELYYSLSCSQGDGICFTGNFENLNGEFKITHTGYYYHSQSVDIEIISLRVGKEFKDYYDLTDKQRDRADFILIQFKEIYHKICDELEKRGYSEIDAENSEENIKDTIETNEYTFRENGESENI